MNWKKNLLISLLLLMILFCSTACEEQINWEERYDILYLSYLDVKDQRDDLRVERNDLIVELADLNIKYTSTLMVNIKLKEDYENALHFISMAEWILENFGVEFYYTGERGGK